MGNSIKKKFWWVMKQIKLLKNFLFESPLQKCQEGLEKKLEEVNLFSIVLIYCITIFLKRV